MPFVTINGVTVPVRRNSWPQKPLHVGAVRERGATGAFQETHVARKIEATGIKLVFQEPTTARAMRRFIDGEGFAARFDDHVYSFGGEGPKAGGTYTQSASGGKYGGKVNVGAASYLEYALASVMKRGATWAPTQGWTVMVWKKLSVLDGGDASTYHDHIATGSVAVVGGASANPAGVTQYKNGVAGNWSMGNWIDVASDGDVGIYGRSNTNGPVAYDYDDLVVLPFAVPSSWIAGIAAFRAAQAWSRLPYVVCQGNVIEESAGLEARMIVTDETPVNVRLNGTHYNNALELTCSLWER